MDCDRSLEKKTAFSMRNGSRGNTTKFEIDNHQHVSAPKIMLVDDEKIVLHFVKRVLKKYRFTVECFADPVEALCRFQKAPYQYDLVITDQAMPEMLGSEMTAHMLQTRPELPIILSSGYSNFIDEHNVHEYGFCYFLAKPIILEGLLKAIEDCLTSQHSNVSLITR